MTIDADNNLLTVYYTMVADYINDANHTDVESSELIISIKDAQSGDLLAPDFRYRISTYQAHNRPDLWNISNNDNSACGNADGCIAYMDWQKIAFNLSNYLSKDILLEIKTGDCSFDAHFGYAYIAAECAPFDIKTENCYKGYDTVASVSVPSGMREYTWSIGKITDVNRSLVWPPSRQQATLYITEEDFRDYSTDGYTLNLVCEINSALDPDLNYKVLLESTVYNQKPQINILTDSLTESKHSFINTSQVSDHNVLIDNRITYWNIDGVVYKQHDTVIHEFTTSFGRKEVSLYVETTEGCSNQKTFVVNYPYSLGTSSIQKPNDENVCIRQEGKTVSISMDNGLLIETIKVYDITGRMLTQIHPKKAECRLTLKEKGVLIVILKLSDGTQVVKKIIQ